MPGEPALVAALEARLTKFESQLKEAGTIADREVSKIEGRFNKLNPNSSFLAGFAKAAVGAFTLERAISTVINTIEKVAKTGDVADRIGISAEALQELQYALKLSGGEADQAGPAMERFSVNLSKAAAGGGSLAKFLRDNGVALQGQNGQLRSTAELLGDVANLIQNARTPQEQLNIATSFFGRQAGPAMVGVLKEGSAGLNKIAQEGRNAGAIMRDETVKEAQRLSDAWDKLVASFSGQRGAAIIEGVSKVQAFLDRLDAWATKVLPILQQINKFNPVQMGLDATGITGGDLPQTASGPARITVNARPRTQPTITRSLGQAQSKDAFQREIEQLEKSIALMEAETAAIDKGVVARDKAKVIVELETAAKQANAAAGLKNTDVTDKQRAKIEELAAAYEKARAASEAANGPLRTFARDAADMNKNLQTVAVDGLKGLEDGFIAVIDGTKKTKDAVRDMVRAIASDFARLFFRSTVTGPASTFMSGFFGGFRAAGGPVAAGRGYIVGENGPEWFQPGRSGMIVPNRAMRSGGGGLSVNMPVTISAPGADPAQLMRVAAAVTDLKKTLPKQILAVQHQMRTRGTVKA